MADKRDNLMSVEELNSRKTPEERREQARKAGIASGEAKRRAKTFREIGQILVEATLRSGEVSDVEEIKTLGDLNGANLSIKDAMIWQQVQKALKGDTKAFEVVRDTIGEKPVEDLRVENKGAKDKLDEVLDLWDGMRK